ncbi:TetR/AcrR family transcriptional regulator [Marinobacter salarius]|nr:TetR/AcrR family transcriptional regulator [Marinobacter salarius]
MKTVDSSAPPNPRHKSPHSRRKLIRVARELLSAGGKEGASSRAICAVAGVGAPTIYHYFGDLVGLHRAAIDETYEQVAEAYLKGAKERGPMQGLRNGWGAFNQFAHQEPHMCRIVIQQILTGNPPASVAETLRIVEEDLSVMYDKGALHFHPHEAVKLLWIGTLGTVCFTATEGSNAENDYPQIQETMTRLVLNALFDAERPQE